MAERGEDDAGGRTAFLVVHGVGNQNRFETLSGFAAGLMIHLERRTGGAWTAHRLLQAHGGRSESFLRLRSAEGAPVDVFEYYYQHKLQRRVAVPDIIDWLLTAARRIRRLYAANAYLRRRRAQARSLVGEKAGAQEGGLDLGYMLVGAGWFVPAAIMAAAWALRGARLLAEGGGWLGPLRPLGKVLGALAVNFIRARLEPLVLDFAGDVVAYTAIDPKAKLADVRRDVLGGCVAALRAILDQKDGERPLYDRIVVAGHSLGSVVAYDALSRLANDIATGLWRPFDGRPERLAGLVTFGSPLDKIALFFWPLGEARIAEAPRDGATAKDEWTARAAALQAGMVAHFHGMRGISSRILGDRSPVVQPSEHPLRHVLWLNYFHPRDIIAGHLDAFSGVTNIATRADGGGPGFPAAHSFYWYDSRMLGDIVEFFVAEDPARLFDDPAAREARLDALAGRGQAAASGDAA